LTAYIPLIFKKRILIKEEEEEEMLLTKLFSFALLAATTQVSAQTLASTAGVPATQNGE